MKTNSTHADKFWKLKKSFHKREPENKSSVINGQGTQIYGTETIKCEYEREFKTRLTGKKGSTV